MSARHERSRLQGLAMESRSILLTIPRMSRRKTESQLPGTPKQGQRVKAERQHAHAARDASAGGNLVGELTASPKTDAAFIRKAYSSPGQGGGGSEN